MEMARYILSILRTQLIIVFSWGFHSPVAMENGLRFLVDGRQHRGWVEVKYDEGADLFRVRTIKDGQVCKEETDVYLDCLVRVIDRMVETK
jgi:hypothetical protein